MDDPSQGKSFCALITKGRPPRGKKKTGRPGGGVPYKTQDVLLGLCRMSDDTQRSPRVTGRLRQRHVGDRSGDWSLSPGRTCCSYNRVDHSVGSYSARELFSSSLERAMPAAGHWADGCRARGRGQDRAASRVRPRIADLELWGRNAILTKMPIDVAGSDDSHRTRITATKAAAVVV